MADDLEISTSSTTDGLNAEDDEEMDDEEVLEQLGDLPVTYETTLAVNACYQDIVQDCLTKVSERHQKVLEDKEKLERELECTVGETKAREWVRVPILQYIPPYFRDSAGMAPKPNCEALFKKAQNELDPLVEPPKKWSKVEKAKLLQGIQLALIDSTVATFKEKRSDLATNLKFAGQGDHEDLTNEILALDTKIAKMAEKVNLAKYSMEQLRALDFNKISVTDMKGTRKESECRLAFFNMFHPSINQDKNWAEDELKRLDELADKHKMREWKSIAQELGTGRTAFQCFEKYQMTMNPIMVKKDWSEEDDEKLRDAVESCRSGQFIPWELVTGMIEGRTRAQCQTRWMRKVNPSLKIGRWSEEEDAILSTAVKKYGVKGWRKIAQEVDGRTEAQCRERWMSGLRGGSSAKDEGDNTTSDVSTIVEAIANVMSVENEEESEDVRSPSRIHDDEAVEATIDDAINDVIATTNVEISVVYDSDMAVEATIAGVIAASVNAPPPPPPMKRETRSSTLANKKKGEKNGKKIGTGGKKIGTGGKKRIERGQNGKKEKLSPPVVKKEKIVKKRVEEKLTRKCLRRIESSDDEDAVEERKKIARVIRPAIEKEEEDEDEM